MSSPYPVLCQSSDVSDVWPGFAALPQSRQTSLIQRASDKVWEHCRGKVFVQAGYNEFHSGRNRQKLWLKHTPVVSIQAITVNQFALDNTLGDAWCFEPNKGYVVRGNGLDDSRFAAWWVAGVNNIEVQYWAGYSSIPTDVTEATCELVKYLSDRGKVSGIYKSESLGDYSYELSDTATNRLAIPPHVAELLAGYVQDDAFE